jgi:hypothetical protein
VGRSTSDGDVHAIAWYDTGLGTFCLLNDYVITPQRMRQHINAHRSAPTSPHFSADFTMGATKMPAIYNLPDELLLQTTDYLRAHQSAEQLRHLRQLCLVSKKLLPIAQEQLYAGAILPISCGCHPKVSAAVQLLRTLLDRADLAPKVKALRFSIVRRAIGTLYEEQGFAIEKVREKCFTKLSKLGYDAGHPWRAALENDLESAYGGVLLSLLPNLEKLDFAAKDHHRGFPTVEPTSAFFGTSAPPEATVRALAKIQNFVAADLSFLRDMAFANLKVMDLKRIDIGTVLRLNGPNTLRGATQLEDLSLGVSIQFLDEDYLRDMQVCLGDVFAALGCKKLARLDIMLGNDAYSLGAERDFRVNYFMSQLDLVSSTLRTLEVDLDPHEDGEEWTWFLSQVTKPIESLEKFPELRRLKMPQEFLFLDDTGILPGNLPHTIQRVDVVAPDQDIYAWAIRFTDPAVHLPNFKTLCLQCRNGLNRSKSGFSERVSSLWVILEAHGIDSYACNIADGEESSLTRLYSLDPETDSDEDSDEDADEWEEEDEESEDSEDDDLPPLEDIGDTEEDSEMELLVDGVD